jgi:hypothetical protein
MIGSPGFSRIRRSRQACHRLKPGLLDISYPGYLFNGYQPNQAFPAGCGVPGRHATG